VLDVNPEITWENPTADEPEPRAVPPLAGARVPNVLLHVPGLTVEYLNHPVVELPFGIAEPLSVALEVVTDVALPVVTVGGRKSNVAATSTAPDITNAHDGIAPVHVPSPDQPANEELAFCEAVSVTVVPSMTEAEHVPGQLIPLPEIVPEPAPPTDVVSVYEDMLNMAVTDVFPDMANVHVVPKPKQGPPPPQPPNVEVGLDVSVSITTVP